jgi:uncharacterized protein YegL
MNFLTSNKFQNLKKQLTEQVDEDISVVFSLIENEKSLKYDKGQFNVLRNQHIEIPNNQELRSKIKSFISALEVIEYELIILLLDVSPSMWEKSNNHSSTKIDELFDSARKFIEVIGNDTDYFIGYIIAFSEETIPIIKWQPLKDIDLPDVCIEKQGTDIIRALTEGLNVVSQWRKKYFNNDPIVICITDGGDDRASEDISEDINSLKLRIQKENIHLFLLGVEGADMTFLRKIQSKNTYFLKSGFHEIVKKLIKAEKKDSKSIIKAITESPIKSYSYYIVPFLIIFIFIFLIGILFNKNSTKTPVEKPFISKVPEKAIRIDSSKKEYLVVENVQSIDKTGRKIQTDIIVIEYLTQYYTWKSEKNKELFADNKGKVITDICAFLFSKPAFTQKINTSKGVICIGNTCEQEEKTLIGDEMRLFEEESRADARSKLLANCIKEYTVQKDIFRLNLGQHKTTGSKETKYQRLILIALITDLDVGVNIFKTIPKSLIKADKYLPNNLSVTNYSLFNVKDSTLT